MASLEIREIESQLNNRLLFNLRLNSDAGRFDFPIGIVDRGSGAANESAVLNVAVDVAAQLVATARQTLDSALTRPPADRSCLVKGE